MNPEYDIKQATMLLQTAIAESASRPNGMTKPIYTIKVCIKYWKKKTDLLFTRLQVDDYKAVQIDQPKSWRITKVASDDPEEEIFQIHGILCQSDLPPIKARYVGVRVK